MLFAFEKNRSISVFNRRLRIAERLEDRRMLSANFSTVDDYQLVGAQSAQAMSVAADAQGDIFAAGQAKDGAGIWHGIVREQSGCGSSWNVILDYRYPNASSTDFESVAVAGSTIYVAGYSGSHWITLRGSIGGGFSLIDDVALGGPRNEAQSVAVDTSGNVWVTGQLSTASKNSTTYWWATRELRAGQNAFATVDQFNGSGNSVGEGIAIIASGAAAGVYTAGSAGSTPTWIVRKSSDGGATWKTVDSFLYNGNSAAAFGIAADAAGNVFVAGQGSQVVNRSSYARSLVRQSTNGGTTWATVNDWALASQQNSYSSGIATDAAGNAYVSGKAADAGGNWYAYVRSNAGGSWHVLDQYELSPGKISENTGIAVDAVGNIYASATAGDSGGVYHWQIRELAALSASIAPVSIDSATGIVSIAITFNRAVSGFDLSDLKLTSPDSLITNLFNGAVTLSTSEGITFILTIPTNLTQLSGTYTLTLTAIGSSIADYSGMSLQINAAQSWTQ